VVVEAASIQRPDDGALVLLEELLREDNAALCHTMVVATAWLRPVADASGAGVTGDAGVRGREVLAVGKDESVIS